jgi:hypothetical protein
VDLFVRDTEQPASRSLNEPVVIVTLVGMSAAPEVSKSAASRNTEKKKRPESLIIASSASFNLGMLLRLKKLFGDVKIRKKGRFSHPRCFGRKSPSILRPLGGGPL